MSLSRSPSPVPGGGWSSPGLNISSGRTSPTNTPSSNSASWESARMRHLGPNGYPSFSTHNQGFFTRHMRRLSSSLPRFSSNSSDQRPGDKQKVDRGRWSGQNIPLVGRIRYIFGRMGRKLKIRLLICLILMLCLLVFYNSRKCYTPYRGVGGEADVLVDSSTLMLTHLSRH